MPEQEARDTGEQDGQQFPHSSPYGPRLTWLGLGTWFHPHFCLFLVLFSSICPKEFLLT